MYYLLLLSLDQKFGDSAKTVGQKLCFFKYVDRLFENLAKGRKNTASLNLSSQFLYNSTKGNLNAHAYNV